MAASLKISELNALTAMADDDLFLVTDTSATTSKKVTFSTLKTNIAAAAHTVIGVVAGTAHLGSFSGSTIADSQTVKQALQALETRLEAVDLDTDDIAALTGVSEQVQNLGTFTGATIADNQTVKAALQALETATELRATSASPQFTGNLISHIGSADHPVIHMIRGGFPDLEFRTNGTNVPLNQNEARILWQDAGGGGTAAIKSIMEPTASMRFFTGGITASEERMTILANGRIGMGVAAPLAQLHVAGSALVQAEFPDFQMRSNSEKRLIFEDNGGAAQSAIKVSGDHMKLFAGGVAAGDQIAEVNTSGITFSSGKALNVDSVGITTIQTGSESHADNDTSLMTSAAIKDYVAANAGSLASMGVTSTAAELNILDGATVTVAELNILDGVTSTAAELNILDGVTATAAELNILDGVTSTAAELNILDGVTSTAAELNILDGVTATAAELNILDGVTATATELNYVDGVTSAIQTQINTQAALTTAHGTILGATAGTAGASQAVILDANKDITGVRNFTITGNLSVAGTTTQVNTVTMEAQNAIVFEGATADDNETTLTIVDPSADRTIKLPNQSGCLPVLAADSTTAITATPEELNVLDGITATVAELNILDGVTSTAAELNILDGVTSTAAELNLLDGVTATTAELNYVDGVTSAIQTQLDAKFATAGGTLTGSLTVEASFPDVNIKSNGERRLIFADGGGSANAALKYSSSELQFTYGGVAGGDVELKIANGTVDVVNSLKIGGVAVTSTAAELNILDGVTSTAAELNILDGVTSTAAELNLLDGVTATTAELNYVDGVTSNIQTQLDAKQAVDADLTNLAGCQSGASAAIAALTQAEVEILDGATVTTAELNILDGVTSTAAELNILDGVTATAAELNLLDGVTATTAELNYVDGVTSNIQTQLDALQTADAELTELATMASTAAAAIADLTATEIQILDGATVTTAELNILDGVTSTAAELNILDGVTSTAAELNLLDGVTATTAEINYLDGVTSNIQTQLDATVAANNTNLTGTTTVAAIDLSGDIDVDGTANLDAVDIDGAVQIDNTVTVGVDDTGYDVKFFGATSGASLLWDESEDDLILAGAARVVVPEGNLVLGSAAVTSTAAELNILDGVTSTAAELNILDGVTSTAAELNILDGVTATAAELNILDGVTSTAAELNLLDGSTDSTWTATLEGSTGNPGSKVTATGQYVRMGKLIMASVHFNNVDTTSYAGDISISGLPVTSKDTSTAMFMGNVYNSGMISGATDSVQALVADNGTTISFLENANNSALQWGTVGAGKHMRVQVVYIAA